MKKYLFKNKRLILIYMFVSVIVYLSVTRIYQLYSVITDIVETMDSGRVLGIVLYSAVVLLVLLVTLIINAIVKRKILFEITYSIRKDIMSKIYKMNYKDQKKENSSYYTSMLVNDITILEESYYSNLFELIGDVIQLAIMLAAIAAVGVHYLLIVLLVSIPSAIQPFILKKQLGKKGLAVSEQLKNYTGKVKEYIASYEIIHIFSRVQVFEKLFEESANDLEQAKNKLALIKVLNTGLVLFTVYFLKMGSQLYFTYNAINGLITIATISLLFGLANNVGNPIVSILSYLEPMNSTKDVRKKIKEFLENEDSIERTNGSNDIVEIESISLNGITFGYDESSVINGLNYTFEKGKKYALVGESGSGKSTILKLLMGYYEGYTGTISINGKDMKSISYNNIRGNIGYLNQHPITVDGSFKDNITFMSEMYSDEEIDDVIKKANLSSLVDSFENGLDEVITANNITVSGGEKQRIAIARHMLLNRKVMLLDEAVSALDSINALAIESRLLEDKEKTVISVIHRINETIESYDKILYLENGKVVESGSYDELICRNSKFESLINAQGGHEYEEQSA